MVSMLLIEISFWLQHNLGKNCIFCSDDYLLGVAKWSHIVQFIGSYIWYVGCSHPYTILSSGGTVFPLIFHRRFLKDWCLTYQFNYEWELFFLHADVIFFWCKCLCDIKVTNLYGQVDWLYYVSFAIVVMGLVIYSTTYILISLMHFLFL